MPSLIVKLCKSTAFRYLFFRYLSYGLQFLNTIILLKYLGGYRYGLYSFSLLSINYLSYTNLGLNQSVNTILSVKKDKTALIIDVWSNAMTIVFTISCIIFLLNTIIQLFYPTFLGKYEYHNFGLFYVFIGLIANINLMYTALYRIFNNYSKINFNQFFPPFITFALVLVFRSHLQLLPLFLAISIAYVFSLLFYIIQPPLHMKLRIKKPIANIILRRGINLMLYNFSYQYISLAAITFVSVLFSPLCFGHFSLSVSISNAFVMLVASLLFMIYPKILNRLCSPNFSIIANYLNKLKDTYVAFSDIIVIAGIISVAVSMQFFQQFSDICSSIIFLLIGQLFNNNSVGLCTTLIAHKKESSLTALGALSILFVILICFLFRFFNLPYYLYSISVMLGLFMYSELVLFYSRKLWPDFKSEFNGLYHNNIKYVIIILSSLLAINSLRYPIIIALIALLFFYVKPRYDGLKYYFLRIVRDNTFFNI